MEQLNARIWGGGQLAVWASIGAALLVAVTSIAAYAGLVAAGIAPEWGWFPVVIAGIAVITFVAQRTYLSIVTRQWRRGMRARSVPDPLTGAVEIRPDALVWRTAAVELHFLWTAISEVLRLGPYWVVWSEAQSIFIPRRWFGDEQEERQFISGLVGRLGAEARARSQDALAFAAGSPPSRHGG